MDSRPSIDVQMGIGNSLGIGLEGCCLSLYFVFSVCWLGVLLVLLRLIAFSVGNPKAISRGAGSS